MRSIYWSPVQYEDDLAREAYLSEIILQHYYSKGYRYAYMYYLNFRLQNSVTTSFHN